ncbi:hypothetical protein [Heyndrickxia faecalis]|jgi:hypothetical protein|uniref:hypothetical protein n=1 Tax=Heyndrickxia faecalis TaxID=2824910 RepID=UPI003596138E
MEKQMMFLQVSGCYLFYKPASMRQCEDFSKDAGRFGLKSNATVPKFANRRPYRNGCSASRRMKASRNIFSGYIVEINITTSLYVARSNVYPERH